MSIRKRTWQTAKGETSVWIVDFKDQYGQRKTKQFPRKKDAEDWNTRAAWHVSQGTHTSDSKSITIAQASHLWLEARRADRLEDTTIAAYEQHLRLHIVPRWGTIKISQLTTPMVERFKDELVSSLSRPMAVRVLRTFKALISEAVRLGHAAHNVALPVRVKRTPRTKSKLTIPCKAALKRLLKAAEGSTNPMALPCYCLLVFGGLRASEIRGLSWASIHFEKGHVNVWQRANSRGILGAPKTKAGERTIPLPHLALKALKVWKLACPPSESDFVFPSLTGKAMTWNYLLTRVVAPVQVEAGECRMTSDGASIPHWSMHSFRHAAASL
ncbi:tyrosine-type recombinase/integrase [Sphingorhabdus sp.]|uniref:tyrosine-type recombinase/integrase n=1 Tax=Sphingorhabdus sp. TaxID=1902408 RepID=UPI00391AF153